MLHRMSIVRIWWAQVLRKLAYGQDAQGERETLVAVKIKPSSLFPIVYNPFLPGKVTDILPDCITQKSYLP